MKLLFMDAESGNAQVKGKKKGQLKAANGGNQFTRLMKKANMFQANFAGTASKLQIKTDPLAKSDHLGHLKLNAADKKGLASLSGKKKGDALLAQPQNALGLLDLNDKIKTLIQKGTRKESMPLLSEKLNKLSKLLEDLGSGEMGIEGESLLARLQALSKKKMKGKAAAGIGTEEPKEKTKGKTDGKLLLPMGISMDVPMIEGKKVVGKKASGKAMTPKGTVGDPRGQKIATKGAIAANKAMNFQLPASASDKLDIKGDGKLALKSKAGTLKLSADLKVEKPLPADLMEKVLEKAKDVKEKAPPLEQGEGIKVESKVGKRPQIHMNTGVRLNEAEVVQLTKQWTALKKAHPKKTGGAEIQPGKQTHDLAAATRLVGKATDVLTAEKVKVPVTETVKLKGKKFGSSHHEQNLKKADGKGKIQGRNTAQPKAPAPGPVAEQATPTGETRVEKAITSPDALVDEILTGKVGKTKTQTTDSSQFRDVLKSANAANGPEQAVRAKTTGSEQKALPQPMFNQMTEGLKQAYILRPRSITVKFTPDDLGEMKVKVAIENDQLRAQIQTESAKVASILKDHQGDLEHRLREQGIQLDKFDVKEESQQFGDRNRGARHEMNGDGQPGGDQNADGNPETGEQIADLGGDHSQEEVRAAVEDGAPLNITV